MPSFQDSAVIFFIALLLFGPKKLPELARQLGKLMGEFRRASNEFRLQMEDELRTSEQAEKQKQIAAIEAAAPLSPVLSGADISSDNSLAAGTIAQAETQRIADGIGDPLDSHPHMSAPDRHTNGQLPGLGADHVEPVPIASAGDLSLMPPATGLPIARQTSDADSSVLAPMFDSIPKASESRDEIPDHSLRAAKATEALTHG